MIVAAVKPDFFNASHEVFSLLPGVVKLSASQPKKNRSPIRCVLVTVKTPRSRWIHGDFASLHHSYLPAGCTG